MLKAIRLAHQVLGLVVDLPAPLDWPRYSETNSALRANKLPPYLLAATCLRGKCAIGYASNRSIFFLDTSVFAAFASS